MTRGCRCPAGGAARPSSISPHISPSLPISPHLSPYPPISPHVSPHLPISPHISPYLTSQAWGARCCWTVSSLPPLLPLSSSRPPPRRPPSSSLIQARLQPAGCVGRSSVRCDGSAVPVAMFTWPTLSAPSIPYMGLGIWPLAVVASGRVGPGSTAHKMLNLF